ncbi:MAG: Adenylate cyclase 2 [Gammaproteobacteria bacterium]|nr:Adenylate cyclase 2 [Gammaproteobacteria bacterium]
MASPARILVVDDVADNVEIVRARLESEGYEVLTAADGEAALETARSALPDLLLLDIMMPGLDGIEVTRRLKADPSLPFMPIILVTAKAAASDVVAGLDSGGDDYLTKPIDHAALMARVRSMLRIKALHDAVQAQARQLDAQATELAAWNRELERRVAAQVAEIGRVGRLRRFLPPQVADLIVAAGDERLLESHRRDIAAMFCDLRGFTAFAETSEPEEVMAVLHEYHETLGPLIHHHEGTLERYVGDGLLVFFNDPLPCPDPGTRAVRLAVAMREAVAERAQAWVRQGYRLGFGVGIAQGYATLGPIGFGDRYDYGAIGTVTNLAARLSAEAGDGQILVSQRVATAVAGVARLEPLGELALKGLSRPLPVHNITGLLSHATAGN